MEFLDKIERKYRKYSIHNLMLTIIIGTLFVYIMQMLLDINISSILAFNADRMLKGEIWRVITFIFVPSNSSPIFFILSLYFYYLAGSSLENEWGSFKFNIYYLVGIIATIIVGFITGFTLDGSYINLSLFLAFAKLFPNYELLIMMIIPVKVKYLGMLNWAIILFNLISVKSIMGALVLLIPLVNYFIFFGKSNITTGKRRANSINRKREFQKKIKIKDYNHKCTVCGVTDKNSIHLTFRYCSKCSNAKCYCSEHINNHIHE